MKHPVRRRLMYLGFQGLRTVMVCLPLRLAQALGRRAGAVASLLLAGQRRLTIAHLEQAFPTHSSAEHRRLARQVFMNLGQTASEWLWLPRLSDWMLERLVTVEGVEHVREAIAEGHGVIAITAHFGNWELIPLSLRRLGFEGGVLARRLRYPEYESFLVDLRSRRGIATIERGSVKDVAKRLRANQVIGVLPDQDMDSLEGIFVDFFGRPAYTPVGPAALSLLTGAPIIPCFMIHDGSRYRLVIEPPIRAPQATDRTEAIRQMTEQWSQVVESTIRRHPDHWVWMHRRWKTKPKVASDQSPVTSEKQISSQSPVASGQKNKTFFSYLATGHLTLVTAFLVAGYLSLATILAGCTKHASHQKHKEMTDIPETADVAKQTDTDQKMSEFTLSGYQADGSKRWELNGRGATVEDNLVTILQPDAVGFDPMRKAYLTASIAQVNQQNRHVRLEHDVTVHTSDGLWFTSPILHWIPDQDQVATDQPVRIETDHMLLRGRGANGFTQLKRAVILEDIEMVLNPSDHQGEAANGPDHVTITCDGPLNFDYEHNIATFEKNVHIQDPSGDLYSDHLVAYFNQATRTIRYAEATGRVHIHQQNNIAHSERAVYEPARGKFTLVGKPSLIIYPSENQPGPVSPLGALTGHDEAAQKNVGDHLEAASENVNGPSTPPVLSTRVSSSRMAAPAGTPRPRENASETVEAPTSPTTSTR